jgi:hypothetical protein
MAAAARRMGTLAAARFRTFILNQKIFLVLAGRVYLVNRYVPE